MWICANCGQDVDENFESCWNCQFDRSGLPPRASIEETRAEKVEETKYPFHWGAFFLAPLWLLFHGRAGMGAFLLLLSVMGSGFGSFLGIMSFIVVIAIALGYGSSGYKIAWENGTYDSFQELKQHERPWILVGIVVGVARILYFVYAVFSGS